MKRYAARPQKDLAFAGRSAAPCVRSAVVNPERENTYSTKFVVAI